MANTLEDYKKYRGKCKELAEEAALADPSLRVARGWYHCPIWGKQGHWWCVAADGSIVDPSVKQFPTNGAGAEYEEFDGSADCAECGKRHVVQESLTGGNYSFCSSQCYGRFVGVL